MRLPQEKIEEIRSANDIIELIGGYVRLKKRGKNYVGLCPFHNEKTPSFNVSPDKQMYHCFGCGAGGNIISFLMDIDKVSFVEAVRALAQRSGILLPEYTSEDDVEAKEQEELYSACRMAGMFFYKNLTESEEGKIALEYFRKRGFSQESIKTFGLGYSFNGWDTLVDYAKSENISIDTLMKAGLLRRREDGTYYDYFRGRAMFPIFSATGRVVGFGARKIYDDDKLGKYINSPETAIYNKSKVLYGISHAKEEIRENDNALLVEGYIDLIKVYQEGFKYVVASSGTALTIEQIRLIARYSKNITIVYDADSAGSKAALRGVDLILENDLDVKVAVLPPGEDPDSYIDKYGGEKFLNLVKNSVSFVDFIAQTFEREGYLKTPEGQAKAVHTIIKTIAKMRDGIKRHFYIKSVSEKYKLYESVLHQELDKYVKKEKNVASMELTHPESNTLRNLQDSEPKPAAIKTGSDISDLKLAQTKIPNGEKDLLHAIIDGGNEIADFVLRYILPENFLNKITIIIFENIKTIRESDKNIDTALIIENISETGNYSQTEIEIIKSFLAELIFSKYELSRRWHETGTVITKGDALQIAKDTIRLIYRQDVKQKLEHNQFLMKEASSRGEDISSYLNHHNELLYQKKYIETENIFSENTEEE